MGGVSVYLTYEEYLAMGGTMGEAEFGRAEFRARKRVDELTDGRVGRMAEAPEAVKLAVMTAIQADGAVGVEAQADSPLAVAFSTDGYSERYDGAAERVGALDRQLNGELRRLLYGVVDDTGVPLLYRGVTA